MLTSRSASKPSRIQPGDEYASFGVSGRSNSNKSPNKSPRKSRKNKSNNDTPVNDGFGYGFDVGSGLSSTGELTNPFGNTVSDYDIEVSYDALSALSGDKRATITQFAEWINRYLQLNWDEQRIKRAWAVLDEDKVKYITFKEFKSGLKSTNSDVILFYSNLMQRTDIHPMKGDKSDWENVNGAGRIKRMREFTPRYLRQFSVICRYQMFLVYVVIISLFILCFCNAETILCSEERECHFKSLSCAQNEECNIICNGTTSCGYGNIYCKEGYDCNILCIGSESCISTAVNCPPNNQCSIDCTENSGCKHSTINCPNNALCAIDCTQYGCQNSIIHCPSNSLCNLDCQNHGCYGSEIEGPLHVDFDLNCYNQGCRNSIITCPINASCSVNCDSSGCYGAIIQYIGNIHTNSNFNISCGVYGCSEANIQCPNNSTCAIDCSGRKGCKGATIYGSNNVDMTIYCTSNVDTESCSGSIIYCPNNAKCDIYCSGGCSRSLFYCPNNYDCFIQCYGGAYTCYLLEIHARYSSHLILSKCSSNYDGVCQAMKIWCPPNTNGKPNCFLEGDDGLNGASFYGGMYLYAVNGFDDIDFSGYSGTFASANSGRMYCTSDYSESCELAARSWTCADNTSICIIGQQETTSIPTAIPTSFPSLESTAQSSEPSLATYTINISYPTTIDTTNTNADSMGDSSTTELAEIENDPKNADGINANSNISDIMIVIFCLMMTVILCLLLVVCICHKRNKKNTKIVYVHTSEQSKDNGKDGTFQTQIEFVHTSSPAELFKNKQRNSIKEDSEY